jgi:DNA-binding HxlR family transcriptional regulator
VPDPRGAQRIGENWTVLVITPLGHSLADTVHVLREWAYANINRIQRARTRYDRSA